MAQFCAEHMLTFLYQRPHHKNSAIPCLLIASRNLIMSGEAAVENFRAGDLIKSVLTEENILPCKINFKLISDACRGSFCLAFRIAMN